MIFTYSKECVGDILMVIVKDNKGAELGYGRKGNVPCVFLKKNGKIAVWNILETSSLVTTEDVGQVTLSDQDVATLNAELAKEGFVERLENDPSPKFVADQIEEMAAHPDSDHLNICQVQISNGKTTQIVVGTPSTVVSLKTIVILPGAMMPNRSLIFPDVLRDEKSFDMICSPRKLVFLNAPQKHSIIELDDTAVVDEAFNPERCWKG